MAFSTTGFPEGAPVATGAQIGDSGTGVHLLAGILAALLQRERSGKGQFVECAMMDCVMNLCRVKFRDHQRIENGPLPEYSRQILRTLRRALAMIPEGGNSATPFNVPRADRMTTFTW